MGAVSAKDLAKNFLKEELLGQKETPREPGVVRLQKIIEEYGNEAFKERNQVLAGMAKMAKLLGYKCGLGTHDPEDKKWDPAWRFVLFLELPINADGAHTQMSWHLHDSEVHLFSFLEPYDKPWNGTTTEQKYERLEQFTKSGEVG